MSVSPCGEDDPGEFYGEFVPIGAAPVPHGDGGSGAVLAQHPRHGGRGLHSLTSQLNLRTFEPPSGHIHGSGWVIWGTM